MKKRRHHRKTGAAQDSKDVFVLGSIEDITVALEDSLVTISTIATRQMSDLGLVNVRFLTSPNSKKGSNMM
jgi:hypothetical protein